MSEDEEDDAEAEPVLVAAGAPKPAFTVAADTRAFDALFVDTQPVGPSRPKFAELCEEPFKPLPRDYATDLGGGVRPAVDDRQPLFADKAVDADRDLEVPTFMRRVQF
jgi:hypothetical protein